MIATASLLLVFAFAVSGCSPTALQTTNRDHAHRAWSDCAIENTYKNARKYDDASMCANIALMNCGAEKNAYTSANTPFSSPLRAVRMTEQLEALMRGHLTERAKQLIADAQAQQQQQPLALVPEQKPLSPMPLTAPMGSPGKTWRDPMTQMEFVWISKGCFQMGDSMGEPKETPVHEVCVAGFWLGKYEVTQGQWQRVMGNNPSKFKQGDNFPVDQVSWHDAKDFIMRLNSKCSYTFRLPTEAEWEYAARSGGRNQMFSGGIDIDSFAWYSKNSGGAPHEVGTKAPNGLGLHDMSGNLDEWCEDIYNDNAYSSHSHDNPVYLGVGTDRGFGPGRVTRGGASGSLLFQVRSTHRGDFLPMTRAYFMGFRLVRNP